MKKIMLVLLLLLLLVGCENKESEQPIDENQEQNEQEPGTIPESSDETPTDLETLYTTNDFTPPTGKADGADDDNPWNSRLLFATSSDGLTWTKTNQLIADQANVPSAVVMDGRIFVYHVTWAEEVRNSAVVAISSDTAETWVFKEVIVEGLEEEKIRPAVDPSLVLLENGQLRMYFTSEKRGVGHPEVFSAISSDGIHFTLEEGTRFSETKERRFIIDPTVLKIEDTWHMYSLYLDGGGNFHATSSDGLSFTEQKPVVENAIFSNGIYMNGIYRFYGFAHTGDRNVQHSFEILSWRSSDGFAWTQDSGVRLAYDNDLEKNFVKDPAVVEVDGMYMMFYISAIPD